VTSLDESLARRANRPQPRFDERHVEAGRMTSASPTPGQPHLVPVAATAAPDPPATYALWRFACEADSSENEARKATPSVEAALVGGAARRWHWQKSPDPKMVTGADALASRRSTR